MTVENQRVIKLKMMKMAGDTQEDREMKTKNIDGINGDKNENEKNKNEEGNRVSPAGRNRDKGRSRLVRDWGEMEKKGGERRGIRGKRRIWRGGNPGTWITCK